MEALQSIIGCDEQSATMYLEMSGGDVDAAVALYFSMMGDEVAASTSNSPLPEWHSIVWPSSERTPDAWLSQTLKFDEDNGLSLSQVGNGPCGVLAAFQAAVIAQCHLSHNVAFFELKDSFGPSQETISLALLAMLSQAATTENIHVARWADAPGQDIVVDQIPKSDQETLMNTLFRSLCVPGGCVLLVVSAVCTRGCSTVRAEMNKEGTPSLVLAPTFICAMELVSLLLCGRATSNILAYDSITQVKQPAWSSSLGVGLLSTHESDGQPLADDLKSPTTPVWVLHGGDHFTVLFSTSREDATTYNGPFVDKLFHHWNGLKPSGPRMASLILSCEKSGLEAPAVMRTSYQKPREGEIEDVVQAHADDRKASDNWREWRFEVVLGGKDEEGEEVSSSDSSSPLFDLSQFPPNGQDQWRCRACYATRFKTMCFGLNDPSTEANVKCEHCDKPRNLTGHSIWLSFEQLPVKWQQVVEKRHGPRIVSLLRTKWPRASVTLAATSQGTELPGI